MSISHSQIPRRLFALFVAAAVVFAGFTPAEAWYYFTASNGERQRWVFESSCNSASSITTLFDSDIPSNARGAIVQGVLDQWNNSISNRTLFQSPSYDQAFDASSTTAFINSPVAGQLRVVWDTDGSVIRALGADPTAGILGIGIPLTTDRTRPQDICASTLVLNASNSSLLSSANSCLVVSGTCTLYGSTLLHEIGHTLGFAHSISGLNGDAFSATVQNLPVMYPFVFSSFQRNTLTEDEKAGAQAIYGP